MVNHFEVDDVTHIKRFNFTSLTHQANTVPPAGNTKAFQRFFMPAHKGRERKTAALIVYAKLLDQFLVHRYPVEFT
jgi:hypothetical protein